MDSEIINMFERDKTSRISQEMGRSMETQIYARKYLSDQLY